MTCPSSEYELVSNTCRIKPAQQPKPKPPPNTTEQQPKPKPPPNTTEQQPKPKPMLMSNKNTTMPLQTGNINPYIL